MPAIVTCPSCNATLKPKTPLPAGARVKCPKCQNPFVVPADDADAPAAPAAGPKSAGPKSAAPRPPAPKPKPAPPPQEEEEEIEEAVAADDDDEQTEEEGTPATKRKGGGFQDKLKKVPLWGWIGGGVAVLFLMCGCCGVPGILYGPGLLAGGSLFGPNVNLNAYRQLKRGMTEDEVKKVMGGAPTTTEDLGGIHADIWKGSGTDFITVQFVKGKAVAAGCQFTEGAGSRAESGPLP